MTHEDFLLNRNWNRFFNLAIILPIVVSLTGIFFLMLAFIGIFSVSYVANQTIDAAVFSGSALFIFLMLTFIVLWLVYVIWFIIEADSLFKLLNINRILGNSLNIIGIFVLSGLSFLVLPIFFYIKVRDYWYDRGMRPNWKGVILDR